MPLSFERAALITTAFCALATPAFAHPELDAFEQSAFLAPAETVACTLENGASAQCYELKVSYLPVGLEIGPFCPATLDDTGGLWNWDGEDAGLYRIDRAFLEMLDGLGYTFYDESGEVYVVDIRTEQPQTANTCLSASADESVTITIRLPVDPVFADTPSQLGTVAKVGVALDGVPIFADAPSILDRGHMPALDLCGGHIDPGGWYHWHGTATDMQTAYQTEGVQAECALSQDASAPFGYAFDGFAMYGSRESDGSLPVGLDDCGGHIGETAHGIAYHYHASEIFPNLPTCLVGVTAQDNFSTTAAQGIGSARAPGGPGGGMPPGFKEAADALGVTPEALFTAIESEGGRGADLSSVAARLGVDESALRAALPMPRNQ